MKEVLTLAACLAVAAGVAPPAAAQLDPHGGPRPPFPGAPGWGLPGVNRGGPPVVPGPDPGPGGRLVNPWGPSGQSYGPRPGGLQLPGFSGGSDPFGWQPGIPGLPGGYDPFGRPGLPGWPGDRPPWAPPTVQEILDPHRPGRPMVGRPFGPLNGSPGAPGGRFAWGAPPGHLPPPPAPPQIDPKVFDNMVPQMPPPFPLKDFEVKPPAKPGGGGAPAWLRWEYAACVLLVSALAGLLHGLFSRKASAE